MVTGLQRRLPGGGGGGGGEYDWNRIAGITPQLADLFQAMKVYSNLQTIAWMGQYLAQIGP
jgi:hypothetical protein